MLILPQTLKQSARWILLLLSWQAIACHGARGGESTLSNPSSKQDCASVRLPTGLALVVLGSGGPRSAGRAASSYLIGLDGQARILVDAGPGAFVRLGETGLAASRLETILLTHLHIDHSGNLPALVKSRDLLSNGPISMRVFGPSGRGLYPATSTFVTRLFGDSGAFAYLPSFRNDLRVETTDIDIDVASTQRMVFDVHGVVLSAVAVDHGDVPAVAYRIDSAGKSIVITGDLASKQSQIEALARGADILVYDAAVLDPPQSPAALYELHTPPQRIGQVAAAAGVKTLVLSHLPPAVETRRQQVLSSVRASFSGTVVFAEDCMQLAGGAL